MTQVTHADGPIAVTGASGYIGAHTVQTLVAKGYTVRACVTDLENTDKTAHLLAMNAGDHSGRVELCEANLLESGSYDTPFADCGAILHVGTPMGYGGVNSPQQVYDGAVAGTRNILASVARVGTVKRVVYTSSFAAIGHPAPSGYRFTEADWASDNRDEDQNWNLEDLDAKGEVGYAMAKVELEHLVYDTAAASEQYDAMSVCPIVVLGPLLSRAHELVGSWQWYMGRMLAGKVCKRGWQHLWNIVDVRDVAAAHVLLMESEVASNGDRYQLSATDETGEIDVPTLQAHLQTLFPDYDVAGGPPELAAMLEKHGQVFQAPLAHCDKARRDLGLQTHNVMDTLQATGQTMIDLGLVTPKLK
ncbi:MAG: NAD-dependent epimerase/dehydratase family protein [Pseudomonadota bacterium]